MVWPLPRQCSEIMVSGAPPSTGNPRNSSRKKRGIHKKGIHEKVKFTQFLAILYRFLRQICRNRPDRGYFVVTLLVLAEKKRVFWVWSAHFWIWSRRRRAQGVGVDPCLLRTGGVATTPDPNTSAKYRDTNGRRIMIQVGGVHTTFCREEAYFCKSIATEMGAVSRYFSKVSGSGVNLALVIEELNEE